MKKSVMTIAMTGFIALVTMGQSLVLNDRYSSMKAETYPMEYIHMSSFNTKQDAINFHLLTLDMIGIDTSGTIVTYDMDVPIFSNFLLMPENKKVIITYVRKNDIGGYNSYFIESKNIEFNMFESDGYLFINHKL
jgi:hypothetical protein